MPHLIKPQQQTILSFSTTKQYNPHPVSTNVSTIREATEIPFSNIHQPQSLETPSGRQRFIKRNTNGFSDICDRVPGSMQKDLPQLISPISTFHYIDEKRDKDVSSNSDPQKRSNSFFHSIDKGIKQPSLTLYRRNSVKSSRNSSTTKPAPVPPNELSQSSESLMVKNFKVNLMNIRKKLEEKKRKYFSKNSIRSTFLSQMFVQNVVDITPKSTYVRRELKKMN